MVPGGPLKQGNKIQTLGRNCSNCFEVLSTTDDDNDDVVIVNQENQKIL